MEFAHTSVLLEETIEGLAIKPDGIYVDGTLGGAGHSSHIAARLRTGRLIGIDQDAEAIEAATKRLEPWQEHVTLVRDNYCNLPAVLNSLGIDKVDGIMLDLGVSSYQLDNAERGFSYRYDTALDMRMDQRQTLTAKTIVNEWSQAELFRCIRDYGEDKFAQNIAKHIVQVREKKPTLSGRRFRQRCGKKADILPNARFRRFGLPATESWRYWKIPWTPLSTGWLRVEGSASSPSIRWKTEL